MSSVGSDDRRQGFPGAPGKEEDKVGLGRQSKTGPACWRDFHLQPKHSCHTRLQDKILFDASLQMLLKKWRRVKIFVYKVKEAGKG